MNFTALRYSILFLNSENYIMHVINHEWNRSMFVASAMRYVWDTKPDLPTIGIRARFSYHVCITCDWVLEFKKTVIFVFFKFLHKVIVPSTLCALINICDILFCMVPRGHGWNICFVPYVFGVCIHQGHHLHILRMGLLFIERIYWTNTIIDCTVCFLCY